MNQTQIGACGYPNYGPGYGMAPYAGMGYAGPAYPPLATVGGYGPMQSGWSIIGAPGDAEPGAMDKVENFLNEETVGLKNGYWLGGAAALGLIWYGYTQRWFGR